MRLRELGSSLSQEGKKSTTFRPDKAEKSCMTGFTLGCVQEPGLKRKWCLKGTEAEPKTWSIPLNEWKQEKEGIFSEAEQLLGGKKHISGCWGLLSLASLLSADVNVRLSGKVLIEVQTLKCLVGLKSRVIQLSLATSHCRAITFNCLEFHCSVLDLFDGLECLIA